MMRLKLLTLVFILPLFAAENIKSVNGVAKANIKAVGPVAEANIKAVGPVDNTAAGGGAVATDDFNRANGGLGANWTVQAGTGPLIASNEAKIITTGTDEAAFWNANTFTDNQYSKIIARADPTKVAVSVRASGTGGSWNAYWARADGIHKHVAGSYTGLGGGSITVNIGDTLELRVSGTTLQRYVNGVAQGTAPTDSSLASGKPGILMWTLGGPVQADDWEGGDL